MTYRFPGDVEGYMGELECEALYRLACNTRPGATIVELGSYKGRSAIAMAQSGRTVWCVDKFEGEQEEFRPLPDHRDGNFSPYDIKHNAERYDVNIRVLDATTDEAYRFWRATRKPPISLLLIDADHHYEAVKRDFRQWSQFVLEDGIVAFDDSIWEGVQRTIMEIQDWVPVTGPQPGSLTVMRRILETSNAR